MADQRVSGSRRIFRGFLQVLVLLFALLMLAWWLFPGFFVKLSREQKVQAAQPP